MVITFADYSVILLLLVEFISTWSDHLFFDLRLLSLFLVSNKFTDCHLPSLTFLLFIGNRTVKAARPHGCVYME
jgi:hypothetical protein